jgi:predicted DNA-binding transcriptional regulator AlpA
MATNSIPLPEVGYLCLKQILGDPKAKPPVPAIIPVSKSTWYEGIKSGRFPAQDRRFGGRRALWNVADIRPCIEPEAV